MRHGRLASSISTSATNSDPRHHGVLFHIRFDEDHIRFCKKVVHVWRVEPPTLAANTTRKCIWVHVWIAPVLVRVAILDAKDENF